MFAIFLKEINSFFSSVIAYVVIGVFLVATGFFLWIAPNSNIFDFGYASLDQLFSLAPWVFIFLIPAITMKAFAEERKAGTIETLLTKPVSITSIIGGKFLADLTLVVFALIPVLVYYITVYRLASPVGNVDSGGFWGSFIGLLFLGAAYVSIGIFSSVINENQVISFITSAFLSYFFYQIIDLSRGLFTLSPVDPILEYFSINTHYMSLSRGVIDSRDVVYFLSFIFLMLFFTNLIIRRRKW